MSDEPGTDSTDPGTDPEAVVDPTVQSIEGKPGDPSNTPIDQLVTDLPADDDVFDAVRAEQQRLGITTHDNG